MHLEALERGMAQIERLVAAGIAVRRAERLRAGPGLEVRVGAPDRVRGVEHVVLALGPLEQVELDEARHPSRWLSRPSQTASKSASLPLRTEKRFIAMYMA